METKKTEKIVGYQLNKGYENNQYVKTYSLIIIKKIF